MTQIPNLLLWGGADTPPRVADQADFAEPLALGESGRGRVLHTLVLDAAYSGGPVQPRPTRDVTLLAGSEHAGLLIVTFGSRAYRRGCSEGAAAYGAANKVSFGSGAHGDAGRTGNWTDTLWAVSRPTVLVDRRLLVTDGAAVGPRVWAGSRQRLTELLLQDERPWLRRALRTVTRAMDREHWLPRLLASIEAAEEIEVVAPAAPHAGVDLQLLRDLGAEVLVPDTSSGLAATVAAGRLTVSPGADTFALVDTGRAGGRRWSVGEVRTSGCAEVWRSGGWRLYRVTDPGWSVEVDHHRDDAFDHTETTGPAA